MRRYTKTFCLFWSVSVSAEMEYRANFVLSCLTTLLTLGGALFTVGLLFQNGHTPGGYSWPAALTGLGCTRCLTVCSSRCCRPTARR